MTFERGSTVKTAGSDDGPTAGRCAAGQREWIPIRLPLTAIAFVTLAIILNCPLTGILQNPAIPAFHLSLAMPFNT